jgi:hypothetical protein
MKFLDKKINLHFKAQRTAKEISTLIINLKLNQIHLVILFNKNSIKQKQFLKKLINRVMKKRLWSPF